MSSPVLSLLLACLGQPLQTHQVPEPLVTARAVRGHAVIREGERPARLRGTVTLVSPDRAQFWLQDNTAGVRVHFPSAPVELRPGDCVEVEGMTQPGEFYPEVKALSVRRRGFRGLPEPLPFDLSIEESRLFDGLWVQAWVVVRGVSTGPGVTRLEVQTSRHTAWVIVPGEEWAKPALALVDRSVVVRGVCRVTAREQKISGPASIHVLSLPTEGPLSGVSQPPGQPAEKPPVLSVEELRTVPLSGGQWVTVSGVVTAVPVPGVLAVQDTTGGVLVWSDQPYPEIPLGSLVEAQGLLRFEGLRPELTRASVTKLGTGELPAPVPVRAEEVANGNHDARFVKLVARVEAVETQENWTRLVLVDGPARLVAFTPGLGCPDSMTCLSPGTQVELRGTPLGLRPDGRSGTGPALYLPGPEALTVLARPPVPAPASDPGWGLVGLVAGLSAGLLAVSVVITVRTLQQRRRAVAEADALRKSLAQLEQRLRESSNLEALGRLTAHITHDFNNLITVINGCAEMLKEEAKEEATPSRRMTELASDISTAAERAADLTGQLLAFTRKKPATLTTVNLNELVSQISRFLARVVGKDVRIETMLTPGLPPVRGDPGQLNQMIVNLAVNARDAMPTGGSLRITTTWPVEAIDERGMVRLIISDTGIGMSEEVKARIFEPFFTTKEPGKGTGLGLSMVEATVRSLGGRIEVDSAPGQGTTFFIDLPVAPPPSGSSSESSPAPSSPPES